MEILFSQLTNVIIVHFHDISFQITILNNILLAKYIMF